MGMLLIDTITWAERPSITNGNIAMATIPVALADMLLRRFFLDKEPETISGRTAALIEERGGIESVAGTVVQTVQEDKFLRALQSYFRIK